MTYSARTLRKISEASQDSKAKSSLIQNLSEIQSPPGEILYDKILDMRSHPKPRFCIEVTAST